MNVSNIQPQNGKPATPAAPPPRSRMRLDAVRRGRLDVPHRVLLYGVEGVGKSTFAAGAPAPVFLGVDAGTEHLDIARLPEAKTWTDALDAVRLLRTEKHDFQTLVIDPVNWLESMLWEHLCAERGWKDIEEPGYGKGYTAASDHWRGFARELELTWTAGLNIVLLAHAKVKSAKQPDVDDYERFQIAMHDSAAAVLKSWCSQVLFARHESGSKTDAKTKRTRGWSTGARVMHTTWNAAWDAKTRPQLPATLPLSWETFVEARRRASAQLGDLKTELARLFAELGDPGATAKATAYLGESEDVGKFEEVINVIRAAIEAKQDTQVQESTS